MKRYVPVDWRSWPFPVLAGCAALAYGLVVLVSIRLTSRPDQVISVCLANGIAMAVIARAPRHRWLPFGAAVGVIDFVVFLTHGTGAPGVALFTLANLCEITTGVALILCIGKREFLDGIPGLFRDVIPATLLAPLISSFIVAATLHVAGRGSFGWNFEQRYMADALGLFVMLPLGLAVTTERLRQLLDKSVVPRLLAIVVCLVSLIFLARAQVFPPVLLLNLTLVTAALLVPLLGSLFVNALCVLGSAFFIQHGIVMPVPVFHSGFDPARYLAVALCVSPAILVAVLIESVRRTELQLINASKRARESEAAKAMFLAVMSHEIRSPLNSIIGFASLLWEKEQGGRNRELIEPIRAAGQILLSVVNDILDFSKFESGHLELEEINFSPEACIRQIEVLFAERARESGLAFTVFIDPAVPATLVGDAHRLRQILINLVSNAIKFTTVGGIELRLTVEGGGDAGFCPLEFTVHDTGIGIPSDQAERIFERFSQVDSSTARRFGGTGLGLAISRSVARAMGGRLWFESEIDHGSVFHFQVSFRQPEIQSPASVRDPAPPQRTSPVSARACGLRILVVDDNQINSRLASLLLKRMGVERVATVNDGRAAIEAVKAGAYDVVLMDCQMPVMDGYETAARIRAMETADPDVSRVVIIALTAAVLPEDRRKALDAGMDDFLEKPVNQVALVDTLEKISSRAQAV